MYATHASLLKAKDWDKYQSYPPVYSVSVSTHRIEQEKEVDGRDFVLYMYIGSVISGNTKRNVLESLKVTQGVVYYKGESLSFVSHVSH